jgi:hypothetical protein
LPAQSWNKIDSSAVFFYVSTLSRMDLMPAKSLVIACIVTLKLSLSGYAAVAAPATQANVAAAEQLGGGKARSSITLVRGGGGGHGGFGGGFGAMVSAAASGAVASDVAGMAGMAGTDGTAATTLIIVTRGG